MWGLALFGRFQGSKLQTSLKYKRNNDVKLNWPSMPVCCVVVVGVVVVVVDGSGVVVVVVVVVVVLVVVEVPHVAQHW